MRLEFLRLYSMGIKPRGYGGKIFGILNVASNGHSRKVSAVRDLV